MEDRVGRDGEAEAWGKEDTPASAKSYYLRVLKPAMERSHSMRNLREMHTLAVILDHLALGRSGAAADVISQRMKALELASSSGNWDRAQFLELVEAETASLVDKQEEMIAVRETELHHRLNGPHGGRSYDHYWTPHDSGKGGNKDWGKNQYHGKSQSGKSKGKGKDKDYKQKPKGGHGSPERPLR